MGKVKGFYLVFFFFAVMGLGCLVSLHVAIYSAYYHYASWRLKQILQMHWCGDYD